MYYIGIDWADDHHDIHATSEDGRELMSFRIGHDSEGFQRLLDKIQTLNSDKNEIIFSIETNQGILVDFILDAGYKVYPINPKSANRYRDRYKTSGVKNDKFDAKVLANILRTDLPTLKPIIPNSELARELKILTRDREALVRSRTRVAIQLKSCLKAYYPLILELFDTLHRWIALAFITKYPTPESLNKLSIKKLKGFFKDNSYPHPDRVEKLYKIIKKEQLPVESLVIRSKSRLALALIAQLKPLMEQINFYQKEIDRLLAKHPDSSIFLSLPGTGNNLAGRILSEFGDNRSRYKDFNSVQCEAGTAPVTKESGNYRLVTFRRACNKHFRDALYMFAFCSLNKSLWAKKYYDNQRARGITHARALRALSNKWVKIIFAMWKNHTLYDEQRYFADKTKHLLCQAA